MQGKEWREREQRGLLYVNTIINAGSAGFGAYKEINKNNNGGNQK